MFGRLVCALPRLKVLTVHNVQFIWHPFNAYSIPQFCLLPRTLLGTVRAFLWRLLEDSGLSPSVESLNIITVVVYRIYSVPPHNFAREWLWSSIRALYFDNVTFSSVVTFARPLCAFPTLESLHFPGSCASVRHGLDLRNLINLSSRPVDVELM